MYLSFEFQFQDAQESLPQYVLRITHTLLYVEACFSALRVFCPREKPLLSLE